jgi:GntR family transcriptional regulator, vanillate catabolism transcriptional regulator
MPDTAEGKTHATRALIELRRRVLGGELAGGTRLYEAALAATLQISRTPVREALARLAEDGLLDRAKGGYVVRTFQPSDVVDAIELRGVLEGTAARLAAERGADPERLDRMRAIVTTLDACLGAGGDIDFEGYAAHNAGFHLELAGLPGSPLLERELERVCRLPFAAPSAFLPDKEQFATRRRSLGIAQAQHRAIVEAIAGREGTRAEHLAREHARLARDDMEYILRERRSPHAGVALVLD